MSEVGPSTVLVILVIVAAIILFGPWLTIWCINTLILDRMANTERLPYDLCSATWFAALISGGILVSPFAANRRS